MNLQIPAGGNPARKFSPIFRNGGVMKKTVRILIVLAMGLVTAIACASDTGKREAAEKMLKATQVDVMMGKMFDQVNQRFEQFYLQMGYPETTKPIYEQYAKKMHDLLAKETSWDKLKDDIVTAYAETYTEKELNEISKFYSSPTGKKYLEKMPELTKTIVTVIQQNMQRISPQMQEITQQMQAELVKAKAKEAEKAQGKEAKPAEQPKPAEKSAK